MLFTSGLECRQPQLPARRYRKRIRRWTCVPGLAPGAFRRGRGGPGHFYGDSQGFVTGFPAFGLRARPGGGRQDDILVAGFEAFQLFQRGVEGAAGGVDAVLEPGEGVVALLDGIGARVEVLRAGSEELIPQGTLDRVEAAKVPFAHDDLVEEANAPRGKRADGGRSIRP